jgi:hypothetical protein
VSALSTVCVSWPQDSWNKTQWTAVRERIPIHSKVHVT